MTESGKSTLAQFFCAGLRKKGILTAAIDPLNEGRWKCDYLASDAHDLKRWAERHTSAHLFLEESGSEIGRNPGELEWFGTQARHFGHSSWFLAQRPVQISATVRGQLSNLFLFAVGQKDLDLLAEEWARPELRRIEKFSQGQFHWCRRFADTRIGYVDFGRRTVTLSGSPKGRSRAA